MKNWVNWVIAAIVAGGLSGYAYALAVTRMQESDRRHVQLRLEDIALKAETNGLIVIRRPTAASQILPFQLDVVQADRLTSSAPNIVSVYKGILWPINHGSSLICFGSQCFYVESKPSWMWPKSPKHDHTH